MSIKFKLLFAFIFGIGLIVVLVGCLLYSLTGGDIPFDHGVIIDAGSSKSEAFLYRWEGDKDRGTGNVKEIDSCKVNVGIDSFANPEDAGNSLLPCLKQVASKVDPPEKIAKTQVYLVATAGMRLLNISNYYQHMAIFLAVKCTLPKSNMKIADVGTISGQDEGLFAWITINFLEGTIQKKEHPTLGALDMGGASTQISFEVNSTTLSSNVVPLTLYGEQYYVYSVSYLCYGSAEIFRRYLASLITDPEKDTDLNNPCGNQGQVLTYSYEWLLDHPCTRRMDWSKTVNVNQDKNFTFKGTANIDQCEKKVQDLLDPDKCKKSYSECFEPIDELMRPKKFIAFSSYFFTVDFMEAKGKSMEVYRQNVDKFCRKTWAELIKIDYDDATKSTLPRYCFQGILIQIILTQGYGFNTSTWSNILFTRKVKDTSLGWSLGYMTKATNAIPESDPTPPVIERPIFILCLFIGIGIIAASIILFVCSKRKKVDMVPA